MMFIIYLRVFLKTRTLVSQTTLFTSYDLRQTLFHLGYVFVFSYQLSGFFHCFYSYPSIL